MIVFSLDIKAVEYCINEKIALNGTTHHTRISNGDDYELEQVSKYYQILKVKHPTNNEVEVVIDGHKKYTFIPQANCDDLPIEI